MSPERHDEDRALREFFAAVHTADRVPPFDPAGAERMGRPAIWAGGRWKPALLAAALLIAISLAWVLPRLAGPAALSAEEELVLARELSSWQAPLDFLLDTPGRDILATAPSFGFDVTNFPPPAGAEEMDP